jgi:hypothetical protein
MFKNIILPKFFQKIRLKLRANQRLIDNHLPIPISIAQNWIKIEFHFQYKFETEFFFLEKLNLYLDFNFHFCVKSKPKILQKNEELFKFGLDFTMALVFIHPNPTSNLHSMMLCIPTNNKMMTTRS